MVREEKEVKLKKIKSLKYASVPFLGVMAAACVEVSMRFEVK